METDRQTDSIDKWDRSKDGWMDGWMDNGWMDGWIGI